MKTPGTFASRKSDQGAISGAAEPPLLRWPPLLRSLADNEFNQLVISQMHTLE